MNDPTYILSLSHKSRICLILYPSYTVQEGTLKKNAFMVNYIMGWTLDPRSFNPKSDTYTVRLPPLL